MTDAEIVDAFVRVANMGDSLLKIVEQLAEDIAALRKTNERIVEVLRLQNEGMKLMGRL